MININKVNLDNINNDLNLTNTMKIASETSITSTWCNIVSVDSSYDLSKKYHDICQHHHDENKWILMINPENDSLEQLSNMGKINPEKILKVNANKVNVSIEHIKKTLLKGNCSAMILANANFNQSQLNEISRCAAIGKTHCILLQKSNTQQAIKLH